MPRHWTQKQDVEPQLPHLEQALLAYSVDELKWYAQLLPGSNLLRKADLIEKLRSALTDPEYLSALVQQLSEEQQWLVADVAYNTDGWLKSGRARARYPSVELPKNPRSRSSFHFAGSFYGNPFKKQPPSAFDILFCYSYDLGFFIASDLVEGLRRILFPPPRNTLRTSSQAPTLPERKGSKALHQPQVAYASAERSVFDDLAAALSLVQEGKAAIGSATQLPTLGTVRQLRKLLTDGDYFEDGGDYERAEEAIRPLALLMLVQAPKWAVPPSKGSTKLSITPGGQEVLRSEALPKQIKQVWEAWARSDLLDELSRVRGIRGQQSKNTKLTKPKERREKIMSALRACPPGQWVEFDEFLRYMEAEDLLPQIERTPESSLYVGYYASYDFWEYRQADYVDMVQGSYIRAFLWEYAATLGIIEIAYTRAEDAPVDHGSRYDLDEWVSRYDGLLGFRVTSLGAYALGLTNEYIAPSEDMGTGIPAMVLLPNFDVVITDPIRVSARDRAFLERICTQQSQDVYRLSRDLLLDYAATNVSGLDPVRKFLESRTLKPQTDFPQTVLVFLADTEKRLNAVQDWGRALVLKGDEHVLTELAHTKATRDLVQLGKVKGETVLLVKEADESAVRRQLKKMGYVPRKA